MSTVAEMLEATQRLTPEERWELYRRLGEAEDVRRHHLAELRQEIAVGIGQIERGEIAPLDIEAIKTEVSRRRGASGKN